jgi:hypothetical protein
MDCHTRGSAAGIVELKPKDKEELILRHISSATSVMI